MLLSSRCCPLCFLRGIGRIDSSNKHNQIAKVLHACPTFSGESKCKVTQRFGLRGGAVRAGYQVQQTVKMKRNEGEQNIKQRMEETWHGSESRAGILRELMGQCDTVWAAWWRHTGDEQLDREGNPGWQENMTQHHSTALKLKQDDKFPFFFITAAQQPFQAEDNKLAACLRAEYVSCNVEICLLHRVVFSQNTDVNISPTPPRSLSTLKAGNERKNNNIALISVRLA